MSYAERTVDCRDCGGPVTGRFSASSKQGCITCNIERAEKAALEMASKSGEAWDNWLRTRGPRGRPRKT